jgi:hypothetical protein
MRSVLIDNPSAHMNLNKEYLPYKHTIGQIVLDESTASSNLTTSLIPLTTEKSHDQNSRQ